MRGASWFLGWCLVVVGCAASTGDSATVAEQRVTPTASRMYRMGEQRFAEGRYAEAVELWRHALLQLPETAAADELRHKLILRMAHGQLHAHHQSSNRTHLENAERMLGRYLVKHEALFGDGARAGAERGQVYEILHEVESRLEPESDETDATLEATEPAEAAEAAGQVTLPNVDDEDGDGPGTEAGENPGPAGSQPESEPGTIEAAPDPERVRTHEGEVLDGPVRRSVRVDTRRWFNTSVDDQEIRMRLRGAFSSGGAAAVVGRPGVTKMHGPRALLRQRGLARLAAGEPTKERTKLARAVGRELFVTARPSLRVCYDQAVARRPILVADSTVEVWVHPGGRVSKARIVEGGLVDGLGDVCLIERLEAAKLGPESADEPVRVRLAMRFFYQGSVYIHGGTGETAPAQNTSTMERWEGDPGSDGVPPIDAPNPVPASGKSPGW